MAEGEWRDNWLRANLSPMIGAYVMVGRFTYCPMVPRVSATVQGCWVTVALKLICSRNLVLADQGGDVDENRRISIAYFHQVKEHLSLPGIGDG